MTSTGTLVKSTVAMLAAAGLTAGAIGSAGPVLAHPASGDGASSVSAATSVTTLANGWTGNLIRNAGAEKTKGDINNYYEPVNLKHWKQRNKFTARKYVPKVADPDTNHGELAKNSPGAENGGRHFFAGAPFASSSLDGVAYQVGKLKDYKKLIKKGAKFKLVGWLGGYGESIDRLKASLRWFNKDGKQVGAKTNLRPVTVADREKLSPGIQTTTMLIKRTNKGNVPKSAKSFKFTLQAVVGGGGATKAYGDNFSLRLHKR